MDIEGFGEKIAYVLFRSGLVGNVADVFDLTVEGLHLIPDFQAKAAGGVTRLSKTGENLLAGIEKSKKRPLANVFFALGIRHVGYETARLLASHFGSLSALLDADAEVLQTVDGIGPIVAKAIADWSAQEANREVVRRLVAAGVNPIEVIAERVVGPLDGLTLVVTGRLETMSRNEAEDRIRSLGGKVGSAVSKSTTALVAGAEAGSKLLKAEKLGVRVIDETLLARLLESGPDVLLDVSAASE